MTIRDITITDISELKLITDENHLITYSYRDYSFNGHSYRTIKDKIDKMIKSNFLSEKKLSKEDIQTKETYKKNILILTFMKINLLTLIQKVHIN